MYPSNELAARYSTGRRHSEGSAISSGAEDGNETAEVPFITLKVFYEPVPRGWYRVHDGSVSSRVGWPRPLSSN